MMARGHALGGMLVGCGVAAVVPFAPAPVRLLAVAATGGAALLPDLDIPSSTAARSLGLLTKLIARGVGAASLAIYHATRGEADPAGRANGHRLATHTLPACLLFGLLASLACLLHPLAGTSLLGVLGGLLGLGLRTAGASLALVAGGGAYYVLTTYPSWWWLFGVSVALGCLAHLGGDVVTPAGIPICWPREADGRRWRMVSTPATFGAGGDIETVVVTPVLGLCLVLAASAVTGVLPVLVSALSAV